MQQSAGPVSVHSEGAGGAHLPSVSLVRGVGLQLTGGGLWFAHSHGGVGAEGAALPLTQLYCHEKNTAPITTTLSRALREGGELSQALSTPQPKHLRMARYGPSARGHLCCPTAPGSQGARLLGGILPLTWALRQRRRQGLQAPPVRLRLPLHPTRLNVYHSPGSRATRVRVLRSAWGAKGTSAAAATAPGRSRVLSNRCSLSLLEWSILPSSKA